MYAEAENELNGPTAEAFARVNAVRERVNLALLDASSTPGLEALRDAIIQERLWGLLSSSRTGSISRGRASWKRSAGTCRWTGQAEIRKARTPGRKTLHITGS